MLNGTHRNSAQEQVVYGRPAVDAVRGLAGQVGASRLLVITTASLAGQDGYGRRLAGGLGPLCVGVFSGVTAHSPRESVIAGAAEARRLGADLLVAVGGGSAIDAAKVMQLALWAGIDRPEGLDAVRAGAERAVALTPGVRMIAVPTTLSAAEFTPFAGVTDTTRKSKEGYAHQALAPKAVVLDPEMTLGTPARLWGSTGIKAVDHAVEQLCAPVRAPFADALAEAGLARLAVGLPASYARPSDLEARLECQIGMWLAMSGASAGHGLGVSHAIGHTLGGTYGVPHGITSCVILPAVLRWNLPASADRQALVAERLGAPGRAAADALVGLIASLGLPTSLSEAGVSREDFAAIAEHTLHDRGVRSNPRPITGASDIVEILELAWRA
ncbi:MAG TPA: iron-containing alcohol dehydrogenase [Caulobacteraceae bacterium]|jgi:maleylacetate reductase|nr:iron-containing alcohol dehydrogenase [Caulobacteraceae bacterium]